MWTDKAGIAELRRELAELRQANDVLRSIACRLAGVTNDHHEIRDFGTGISDMD